MFTVIELQSGIVGSNVWAYETKDEAASKMHAVLSVAAKSSVPVHAAVILNDMGERVDGGCYTHNALIGEE